MQTAGADDDNRENLSRSRVEDIKLNDGELLLEIVGSEKQKSANGNSFIAYQIRGADSLGQI